MSAIIKYFWIAEYGEGEALPQFDPVTGKENMFKDIDMDRLTAFGWYPFNGIYANKARTGSGKMFLRESDNLVTVRLMVPEGKKLQAVRRQSIDYTMTGGPSVKNRRVVYVAGYEDGPWFFLQPDRNIVEVSWDFNYI